MVSTRIVDMLGLNHTCAVDLFVVQRCLNSCKFHHLSLTLGLGLVDWLDPHHLHHLLLLHWLTIPISAATSKLERWCPTLNA